MASVANDGNEVRGTVEINFDGLVGPTHNHAGGSPGNLASVRHGGGVSNPRQAALQGLSKMAFIHSLGVGQALLPPQERPALRALRALGFTGSDAEVVQRAARSEQRLLELCSSSSSMWTANAATVAPSSDTLDGKLHLTVANLSSMFHRSLEAPQTYRVLSTLFSDSKYFAVHPGLPGEALFSDEGAANHTRLETEAGSLHLFGWGRSHFQPSPLPELHPARQSREASAAVARLNQLSGERALLWQQSPYGIDCGSFHSDVLAVGNGPFFLFHEHAFCQPNQLSQNLQRHLGDNFILRMVTEKELPAEEAVAAYPFNSQLLTLDDGRMALVAPEESRSTPRVFELLGRLIDEDNPLAELHFQDVAGSMRNGGGPACLRLRIALTQAEREAVRGRVFLTESLLAKLQVWVKKHYRDRLRLADLADPQLLRETQTALDELCQLLELGSLYDFQQ